MKANLAVDFAERGKVRAAIAKAESKSSVEIVCAVTTESGRYDRSEGLIGLFFGLLGLMLAHLAKWFFLTENGDWSEPTLHLGVQALAVVVGYIFGNLLASYWHPIRRLVTSENEMMTESQRAANQVFLNGTVGETNNQTGLLILVSLFEHRVVIIADTNVHAALGQEKIDEACARATKAIHDGTYADAFIATIEFLQDSLVDLLPADRELDENELNDHLVFFHPRP